MVTKANIKEILKCSDLYAQKMINWAKDDEELNNLINSKLEEKHTDNQSWRCSNGIA